MIDFACLMVLSLAGPPETRCIPTTQVVGFSPVPCPPDGAGQCTGLRIFDPLADQMHAIEVIVRGTPKDVCNAIGATCGGLPE